MKIINKKDLVFALETRKGIYILAQAMGNHSFLFFNCFSRDTNNLLKINLEETEILCCIALTKNFLKNVKAVNINAVKINIKPKIDVDKYIRNDHLALELFNAMETFKIYKDTEDELEISIRSGKLRLVNSNIETIKNLDNKLDEKIIEKYQLDTIGEYYPELLEKLYLSYKFERYVEPQKDLIIGKKIPLEYKIYYRVISGKITKEEWKKLPI